jgi:chromosome segregation ATPase
MGQDAGQGGAPVEREQRSPEELRREIEETRRDLGDTAAALAEKTDVKARAKEKLEDVKRTVGQKKEAFASRQSGETADGAGVPDQVGSAVIQARAKARENPVLTAAVGAFIGGFIFGRITTR